jgi:hypothetical protein
VRDPTKEHPRAFGNKKPSRMCSLGSLSVMLLYIILSELQPARDRQRVDFYERVGNKINPFLGQDLELALWGIPFLFIRI